MLNLPRVARIKREIAIYHIMSRSITEIDLFRNDKDKNVYLKYVRKYKDIFSFKVYAFCLMNNHVHFLINSNGSDISKFMHCINQCYSQYFNKKYNRSGPLFRDRFKSKIADTDVSVINISAYIHNNPKDIRGYMNCVENYKYSSLGIYLGKQEDNFKLLDKDFILGYFSPDPILSVCRYVKFVKSRLGNDNITFINEANLLQEHSQLSTMKSYNKPVMRNINPEEIIKFISEHYSFNGIDIHVKYNHISSKFRSICIFLMRNLCNLTFREMLTFIGNLTLSSLSRLCSRGYYLVTNDPEYKDIINFFVEKHLCSKYGSMPILG